MLCGNTKQQQKGFDRMATTNMALRNRWAFSLGTIGRDVVYNLFTVSLMSFILFAKSLTNAQYAAVGTIFVVMRFYDALIDPFIGGMVDGTRSRFGKFKPWIFVGMVVSAAVIVLLFTLPIYGWDFVVFMGVGYVMFATFYSFNDIAYWAMLPALSSDAPGERHRLVSLSNICAAAGAAMVMVLVPMLTAGERTIGGNALRAYAVIAVVGALLFIGFQSITLVGVKEPRPQTVNKDEPKEKLGFKNTVLTVWRNDQLLWASVVLLLQGVMGGVGPVGAGISMAYIYLKYGYNGMLMTFSMAGGISTIFIIVFLPKILERISRKRFMFLACVAAGVGAAILLLSGLVLPREPWLLSFGVYAFSCAFTVGGNYAFYQVLFIDIANTVEYNELKTGRRSEGLIFSLRPLMTQMASGVTQLIAMVVLLALGITDINREISNLENQASQLLITAEEKLEQIEAVIGAVPAGKTTALLLCLALFPLAIALGGYWIYKTKFKLSEEKYAEVLAALEARRADENQN